MDQELKDLIKSLDARLASMEMMLRVIASNSQPQGIGGMSYFGTATTSVPTKPAGAGSQS